MIEEDRPLTAAHARRSTSQGPGKMASPVAADLIGMFVQRNPKSSRGELSEVVKLVAEFSATATKLSPTARKRLIARKAQFKKFIAEIAAEPEAAPQTLKLVAKSPAEVSQGAGLGQVLSADAGRARIAAYATPAKVEDWAGPLAGPTELERDFGVARSTLHNWQKQGAVIGLLVGVRKHAFPTEQFQYPAKRIWRLASSWCVCSRTAHLWRNGPREILADPLMKRNESQLILGNICLALALLQLLAQSSLLKNNWNIT